MGNTHLWARAKGRQRLFAILWSARGSRTGFFGVPLAVGALRLASFFATNSGLISTLRLPHMSECPANQSGVRPHPAELLRNVAARQPMIWARRRSLGRRPGSLCQSAGLHVTGITVNIFAGIPRRWAGENRAMRQASSVACENSSFGLSITFMVVGSIDPSSAMMKWTFTIPPMPAACSRGG